MKFNRNGKKFLIALSVIILGLFAFYLMRPVKTEAEILGDEKYNKYVCLTPNDKRALNKINEDYQVNMIKAQGEYEKEKAAFDKKKESEKDFYKQVFFANQIRFKGYYDKIKTTEQTHPEVWKDELFLQKYFLFQTHVENDRFSEAETTLVFLEDKLDMPFLNN